MALNQEQLTIFRVQKERLGKMLSDASEVINELNMTSASENLSKLSKKVEDDKFKIQIVGTFSNGKSTVINALLGENVLPAYALPTTAVINEVKHSDSKGAILYFRNPLPDNLPNSLSPKALEHMKAHGMENIPPLRVDYSEIEDYVVIPLGEDPKEMLLESPYEKVELFWPLPMLKEGVEIIDSPGLNESETRAHVTMDYLTKADAILFVLAADKLCAQDEMHFIENNLKENGFTEPFFVVNKYDLIQEREKERVKKFAELKLSNYSTNPIFFISAQLGLDGQINKDDKLYETSQMGLFSDKLSEFLTKDKGKLKLSQPARELKRVLNNEVLYKAIPSQRTMLDSSLDELKRRYDQAKPQLETLKSNKAQLVSKLQLKIEQSKLEFKRFVNRNYLSLADMIPGWIDEFQPENKFSVIPTKKKSEIIVSEITEYVSSKIQEQQNDWKKDVLQPIIEEKANYIFDSATQDLTKIFSEIDAINADITGNHDIDPDSVPLWQRIAGAAGGLLLGDVGLAFSGGMNGLSKDLAKTAAFEIGAGFILGILGLLNPFTIAAILLAAIIKSWKSGASTAMKKTKSMVSDEIVKQLSNSADEKSTQMAESICNKLSEVADTISSAVDNEIHQTEQQVESIIEEMKKGQANIDARKSVIDSCEAKIKEINTHLDELTFELLEQK
jgi:predicted GTPase